MSDIPGRLAAALSDRYVVERQVGAGGMATVYLARDVRHKRLVALKIVRPELGGRVGVERFLREIELAARLLDSLMRVDPDKAGGIEAWAVVLGLTPPSFKPVLDSFVKAMPPGPEAVYANAMVHLLKGQMAEGRRLLARTLGSRDSASIPVPIRGLMIAGDGWAALLQGDSVAGIRRMPVRPGTVGGPERGECLPSAAARAGARRSAGDEGRGDPLVAVRFRNSTALQAAHLSGARPYV